MAAIAPAPSLLPGIRVRRPRTPAWLGSAAVSVLALAALGSLVPPALAAVASGQLLPASAARPSVALEGTVETAGLPLKPALSTLVVRNTGSVTITWRVRSEVTGPGAASAVVVPRLADGTGCTAASPGGAALDARSWSAPLAPGATATLCVTVTSTDPTAGGAAPTVHVDAHAA
jgi:hypothetical protein